jgi:hypothetical protein
MHRARPQQQPLLVELGVAAGLDVHGDAWLPDTGLSNNVAWPAQFANRHGIGTFRNFAVSGSEPQDWLPAGSETDQGGQFFPQAQQSINASTDLTVLTLGANPLLGTFLRQGGDFPSKCGSTNDSNPIATQVSDAEGCAQTLMTQTRLYDRLRAIYRWMLSFPENRIVVMQYQSIGQPAPGGFAELAINHYPAPVIDRISGMVNDEIARAVNDEAAAAKADGKGDRLFLATPPRFFLGFPGYQQVILNQGGVTCPTGSATNVDGPSNQSMAIQKAGAGTICPRRSDADIFMESLDGGMHLAVAGARTFADTLDSTIGETGLTLPK